MNKSQLSVIVFYTIHCLGLVNKIGLTPLFIGILVLDLRLSPYWIDTLLDALTTTQVENAKAFSKMSEVIKS